MPYPAITSRAPLAAALIFLALSARAADNPRPPVDPARHYEHCIALAKSKPADGLEEGESWAAQGGGEPARHCVAVAYFGLGQYERAAKDLEDLFKHSQDEGRLRAGMLAQAGQAWLLAGKPSLAYADQTSALELLPGSPDLLIDRAESLAMAKNYRDALADLDAALKADPRRADALTFRATAKRYLDNLQGAAADVAAAVAIDPGYPEAWLESGIVKRLRGDRVGARQDWMKVLQLAPNSAAADTARRNLEKMDVKQ